MDFHKIWIEQCQAARGIEGEMARTRAGRNDHRRGIGGHQNTAHGIESIDEELVGTQIGDEGKMAGGIDIDRMGVGVGLPSRVDAGTGFLDDAGSG